VTDDLSSSVLCIVALLALAALSAPSTVYPPTGTQYLPSSGTSSVDLTRGPAAAGYTGYWQYSASSTSSYAYVQLSSVNLLSADSLTIYDGSSSSANVLAVVRGGVPTSFYVYGSGRYLYMTYTTSSSSTGRGKGFAANFYQSMTTDAALVARSLSQPVSIECVLDAGTCLLV
jgi:hypothetical protein